MKNEDFFVTRISYMKMRRGKAKGEHHKNKKNFKNVVVKLDRFIVKTSLI